MFVLGLDINCSRAEIFVEQITPYYPLLDLKYLVSSISTIVSFVA